MKRYCARLQTILGMVLSFSVFADGYLPELISQDHPWSVTASVGSVNYQISSGDRNSALGRLAVGNEMLLAGSIALGLELGLQTGNKICLNVPEANEEFDIIHWAPISTKLSPTVDFLITTKSDPLWNSSFFAQLKGGLAYRHWKIENIPVNEISQLAGEVQAGLGYPITALASLSLLYQGIYSNKPNLQQNPYSKKEQLNNIPTLHAVLVGLSVNL